MTLYPKAVVLTNAHPYGGTEMMARALAAALNLHGYEASIANVDTTSAEDCVARLIDPDLRLVMTTGTLPLMARINGKRLWDALPHATFLPYIIDAWPHDYLRVPALCEYMEAKARGDNPCLQMACLEANNADLIGAHYLPSGPYPAPWRDVKRNGRLMVWGSVGGELAQADLTLTEALRESPISWGIGAIAKATGESVAEIMRPERLSETAALDASLKRYRRVKVVQALKGLPVDIYGKGWEPYLSGAYQGGYDTFRILTPEPDHNQAFGHICQAYAGVVNFDPNFGHGTNERAMTALAMGMPLLTNHNDRVSGLPGCSIYSFSDLPERIHDYAEQMLDGKLEPKLDYGWDEGMGRLLAQMGALPQIGALVPVAGTVHWHYDVPWNKRGSEAVVL